MPKQKNETPHLPVLLREVMTCLMPRPGHSFLDVTAGYGGHARAVINATGAPKQAVLVDRDELAVAALQKEFAAQGAAIIRSDFLSTLQNLAGEGREFDLILADLGVSSPHLERAERGFSFGRAGPLDMRMDQTQRLNAEQIINWAKQEELADILRRYGEEPKAAAIAAEIVANRPVRDTGHLAEIIKEAARRGGHSKIHPATKSFQAIRIAVNDELRQLEQGLPLMARLLAPDGRLAIISFHSLEDRLVKRFFAERAGNTYDAEFRLLTKRPITAGPDEIASNPRARSAKLRAAAKIKTNRKE